MTHPPTQIYYVQYLHRADSPYNHTLSRNKHLIHTSGPFSSEWVAAMGRTQEVSAETNSGSGLFQLPFLWNLFGRRSLGTVNNNNLLNFDHFYEQLYLRTLKSKVLT